MAAYEAGVHIYAGTDAGGVLPHGLIADEVREPAAYGIPVVDALAGASWKAREWLGLNPLLDAFLSGPTPSTDPGRDAASEIRQSLGLEPTP